MKKSLAPMPQQLLQAIIPQNAENKSKSCNNQDTPIEDILSFINPDESYDTWIKVGMALKASGHDVDIFDQWSKTGKKYRKDEIRNKWDSFDTEGAISSATIIYYAQNNGWKGRYVDPNDTLKQKTYEELSNTIKTLDQTHSVDDINNLISDLIKAKLDPIHADTLFKAISDKTPYSSTVLRQQADTLKKSLGNQHRNEDVALSIAHRLLEEFFDDGHWLIYTSSGFYEYRQTHWHLIREEYLGGYILFFLENSHFSKVGFSGIKNSAIDLLKSKLIVNHDPFARSNQKDCVINCRNGELWIDENGKTKLRPHAAKSYLNYVLSIDYDQNAKCPRFDKALLDVFQNSKDPKYMRRHLHEIIGYIIQSNRFIPSWFMFYGRGENGKTAVYETIEKLLSKEAIFADRIVNLEKNRFAIGALYNKLLLVDDDVDANTRLPDGLLKKLSERKLLTGEKKFQDTFEFTSVATILLLANNYPLSNDTSHGMIRRSKVIPFAHQFTKKDRDNKLYPHIWENEMSGVLNQAIKGLKRLIKRREFKEPQDCIDARNEWLSHANPFMGFLHEKIARVEKREKHIALEQIKHEFEGWLLYNNSNYRCTSQKLRNLFEAQGFSVRKLNGCLVVDGARLKK